MLKTPVDFFKPPAGAVSYSDLRKATSAARSAAASPPRRSRAPAPSPPCSSIACSSVAARPSWRKCSAPRRSSSGSVRKSAGVARPRQMSARPAHVVQEEVGVGGERPVSQRRHGAGPGAERRDVAGRAPYLGKEVAAAPPVLAELQRRRRREEADEVVGEV